MSLPDELTEALKRAIQEDPSSPTRSSVVARAIAEYLEANYPSALRKEKEIKGPKVLTHLQGVERRGPSPTLRAAKLDLPGWTEVED